ncbi:F/Y rich C-terminus-domain-containing protein [Circinella umbellata]|nr:F/Y rich C-terminus-domain-containing protein [Circinella umbellata]
MSRTIIKTRRVQPVERDENGNIKLPQQIGVLTVVNLGKIIYDREAFHNERYIFPVGFTVERTYPSMINPHSNTSIVSTILDGGDGPRFHIVAADMPDQPIIANSATGAWTVVVRRSNEIRQREHSNSASGPDYYGFKHPTIAKMIQDLPNAYKLRHYVRQNFEEMEPRAAKGVMAAAQKKRGNLEQMGNANVRPQNNNMRPPDDMEEVDMDDDNNSFIKPSSTTPLPSPPSNSTSLSFITSAVSQHNQHRYQQQHNQNQEKTTNENMSSLQQQKNDSYNNPHSISNLLQPISPSPFKVMNGFGHKYNENDNNDDDQVDQLHSDNDNEIF